MVIKKIIKWAEPFFIPDETARRQYDLYQQLLREDRKCLRLITRLEEIIHRPILVDWTRIALLVQSLSASANRMVNCLEQMRPNAYPDLMPAFKRIDGQLGQLIPSSTAKAIPPYALDLKDALEHPELTGFKAFSLARIVSHSAIPVPPGFVVTTNAYKHFLEKNGLREFIKKHLRTLNLQWPKRFEETASIMRKAILGGSVPSEVQNSIVSMLERIDPEGSCELWAVRSSALGEDGQVSFAGQYETLLNVVRETVLDAYKTVLAGKYSVRAMTYRLHNGISDSETPMAVLFFPMIESRSSGVVYTLDPLDICGGSCMVIACVPGPGSRLVDGSSNADIFLVSRDNPTHLLDKQKALSGSESISGRIFQKEQKSLCLDDQSAITLAKWGLELEALAETPQDIEWVQDNEGRLFVLQSRAITGATGPGFSMKEKSDDPGLADPGSFPGIHGSSVLKMGTSASKGVAAGPVYRLFDEEGMKKVPQDAILVTVGIPPYLVGIVKRVGAVVAEKGSKASHFASVAREFGLPIIVGAGNTKEILKQGQVVTVDAYQGAVYDGLVKELFSRYDRKKLEAPEPFRKKLAPLLSLVSALNLTDSFSPDFSPRKCRSFHDLVRFVHEKGTQEMFSLVDSDGPRMRKAKLLETDIPIVMHILDLSDGVTGHARKLKNISPEHIRSIPMQAFWEGLTDRDIRWSKDLLHVDWEHFDRISGGIMGLKSSLLASYALLARHYAHLLLRFGYHFAVLDTMSGNRADENYIQFRFKGGGGTPGKKLLRLTMVEKVLKMFGFRVTIREDLLESRCNRLDQESNQFRLKIIGYLLGHTPLLDMALEDQESALKMADDILKKWRMKENEK